MIPSAPQQAEGRPLQPKEGVRTWRRPRRRSGGYSINFKGCKDSVEAVFGGSPIGPSDMTKKLWAYVKRKKLAGKR